MYALPNAARLCAALFVLSLWLAVGTRPAGAYPTTLTYTGQLLVSGAPVTGNYDFQYSLYTAATGGSQVGSTVTVTNVAVADGVYYVQINFGNAFATGSTYFLQAAYRHAGSGSYVTQTPRRQAPTSAYAEFAGHSNSTLALQAKGVSAVTPTDGQALIFNAATNLWTPSLIGASSLVVPLSLSGSTNSPVLSVTSTNTSGGNGIDTYTPAGIALYANTDSGIGVYGSSNSSVGVEGQSGNNIGIAGYSGSSDAVFGDNTTNGNYGSLGGGNGNGVDGVTTTSNAIGVSGRSSQWYGVYGVNGAGSGDSPLDGYGGGVWGDSADGIGLVGTSSTGYGVYGTSNNGNAGYFAGNVTVTGSLSKAGGSFKIDHPLDPEHKYLYHSFVESPDMMNIYNGDVTLGQDGTAWVTMPDWFEALNQDFRYQLTAIGAPGPNLYIAQKVQGNKFQIAGGQPGAEVSWQVTGIRHDAWANAHRIPVEENKPAKEQGLYLHPEEWGQPEERGVDYARQQKIRAKK